MGDCSIGEPVAVPGRGAGVVEAIDAADVATVRLYRNGAVRGDRVRVPIDGLVGLHEFTPQNRRLLTREAREIEE
jgi:hypothetical protein